jgi:hypothetical protein
MERDIAGDIVDSIPVGGSNPSPTKTNLLPPGCGRDIAGDIVDSIPVGDPVPTSKKTNLLPPG